MSVRIQRSRAKGWRMPPGAVYVGRPSAWGNPFDWSDDKATWMALAVGERADKPGRRRAAVTMYRWWLEGATPEFPVKSVPGNRENGGDLEYSDGTVRSVVDIASGMGLMMWLKDPLTIPAKPDLEPLRGKTLVCWCPVTEPCHADVLLELAAGVPA
jgi:hypothetical protein